MSSRGKQIRAGGTCFPSVEKWINLNLASKLLIIRVVEQLHNIVGEEFYIQSAWDELSTGFVYELLSSETTKKTSIHREHVLTSVDEKLIELLKSHNNEISMLSNHTMNAEAWTRLHSSFSNFSVWRRSIENSQEIQKLRLLGKQFAVK